jgi:hypothetical protein
MTFLLCIALPNLQEYISVTDNKENVIWYINCELLNQSVNISKQNRHMTHPYEVNQVISFVLNSESYVICYMLFIYKILIFRHYTLNILKDKQVLPSPWHALFFQQMVIIFTMVLLGTTAKLRRSTIIRKLVLIL